MNGLFIVIDNDLAKFRPINIAPINPGSEVAATKSISLILMSALLSDASVISTILRKCSLDAISGTTPPNVEWYSCERITFDKTLSFCNTATEVSSQDDSKARIFKLSFLKIHTY
jgi:hypothetical protein